MMNSPIKAKALALRLLLSCGLIVALPAFLAAGTIEGSSLGTIDCVVNGPLCHEASSSDPNFQIWWEGPGNQVSKLTTGLPDPNGSYAIGPTSGGADIKLGVITWDSKDNLKTSFFVNWVLTVNLGDANDQFGFTLNGLKITLSKGGALDTIELSPLNYATTIDGWTLTSFHYVVEGDGSIDNNIWKNAVNGTSQLYIVADFAPLTDSTKVPEPGLTLLLGIGFGAVSLASLRWRQ